MSHDDWQDVEHTMDFNLEIDLKDIMRSVSMSVGSKNIQSGEYYIDIIFKNNGDCLRIRILILKQSPLFLKIMSM